MLTAAANPADVYDLLERSEHDLPFWVELGCKARGTVLELGCGTGRVSAALARAGCEVLGLDQSDAMLDGARRRGVAGLETLRADIRRFDLGRRFDLIVGPARVFEHLTDQAAQRSLLRASAAHLLPGGCLALHLSGPPPDGQPTQLMASLPGGAFWLEEIDRARHRRSVSIVRRIVGTDQGRFVRHGPLTLKWTTHTELSELVEGVGLARVTAWRGVRAKRYPRRNGDWLMLAEMPKGD